MDEEPNAERSCRNYTNEQGGTVDGSRWWVTDSLRCHEATLSRVRRLLHGRAGST